MKCPQHYLTKIQEVILFYNGLGIPTRQILDSRGAIPSKIAADAKVAIQEWLNTLKNGTIEHLGQEVVKPLTDWNNANPSYQERRLSMEDTLSKFMSESAKRHEEKSNLIKEIRALTDAAIRNQGASIKTLKIQIGQMSKKRRDHMDHNSRKLTLKLHKSNNSIPQNEKDPGSFTLLCFINKVCFDNALVDIGASFSVMPLSTYLNLGLGELAGTKLTVELADRTVKYPKGIAENVLVDYFADWGKKEDYFQKC
ncbi:NUDIX hydrolase 6-like protein [Tanacetum coccineum]